VIVDLSDRQVYLFRLGRIEAAYPVAVGQAGWETPTGMYRVIQLDHDPIWRHPITKVIVPPGDNNPLGSRWIGFWTDGEYQFGIHGTNQPELIGQAVSHGCLRMHNADIETLFEQIYLGTPLIVRP
jgi:lipoprotein-anchoring transpeptidase ErfK/SrfK